MAKNINKEIVGYHIYNFDENAPLITKCEQAKEYIDKKFSDIDIDVDIDTIEIGQDIKEMIVDAINEKLELDTDSLRDLIIENMDIDINEINENVSNTITDTFNDTISPKIDEVECRIDEIDEHIEQAKQHLCCDISCAKTQVVNVINEKNEEVQEAFSDLNEQVAEILAQLQNK